MKKGMLLLVWLLSSCGSSDDPCQPATCQDLGKECGAWDDGCGTDLYCGGCTSLGVCNAQGQCEVVGTPAIVAGGSHTCKLTGEGIAWCWGRNDLGQLGDDGAPSESQVPVPVSVAGMTGETAFVQITAGLQHTCGLTTEGAAWCWGSDSSGQLGDGGSSHTSHVPVKVNTTGMAGETAFVHIVAGGSHTCGLVASGDAWCWGRDNYGQLGDGGDSSSSQLPVPVDVTGMAGETAFVQLTAGFIHTCGTTTEGAAWCWGCNDFGKLGDGGASTLSQVPVPVDVTGMTGETAFVQLAAGREHTCGLVASGAAWCWGRDTSGQLGDGAYSNGSRLPVPVEVAGMTGETGFVQLTAGDDHNCGLTASGVAWCWGSDAHGQLGDGGASLDTYVPVPVDVASMAGETTFVQLDGGEDHTCGLAGSGDAWCWGRDLWGQLGDGGTSTDSQVPVQVATPP